MAKAERFTIAFDSHGHKIDREAADEFHAFVKHYKPTLRIHGGDFLDLPGLRRGADEEDRTVPISEDFDAGMEFLRRFDPQVVVLGNHDDRLWQWSQNHANGAVRTLCSMLIDAIHDRMPRTRFIEHNKRTGIYRLGQYAVIHGYNHGLYAVRQAVSHYHKVIMGHVHSPGFFLSPDVDSDHGYSSGCLCALELGYNAKTPSTLRQAHGWVYGTIRGRVARVQLAMRIAGHWVYDGAGG